MIELTFWHGAVIGFIVSTAVYLIAMLAGKEDAW